MDFDTGSSDFWVFSTLLPSSESAGHTLYNASASKHSSLESGETWSINYGDGSGASGVIYSDRVVLAGVTATSQAVEAATSVSSAFTSDTQNDGLVGLAFDGLNTASPSKVPTFFQTVQKSLFEPVFASALRHNAAGTYDFGWIDPSKYTGKITYTPVSNSSGYWEITANGYAVGSGATVSESLTSIVDTGTTLIYMPDDLLNAYYSQVNGSSDSSDAGGWIFPCDATLPDISFEIGSKEFTVPGSYINYSPYTDDTCYGGMQSSDGFPFNVLGDVFIKSQYIVWAPTVPQMGFAAPSRWTKILLAADGVVVVDDEEGYGSLM
ncbi:hypothetical protein BT93_L4481 [Corymbia citriodora subsp. variegata]|uniref:Peptidase A1 domain-containing protein n=1 Tax=Corymbia citriodora subsp. variegata TaxID=360336 RepID=A0A8T0CFU7_CORYI|nr:hypothetical protein BT93_L4481 [Corymbia citriodora subsp. variegata]